MKRAAQFAAAALALALAASASDIQSGATQATKYADSANLDAFGRLRASDPTSLFDTQFQYGLQTFLWESVITGGGTVTHVPSQSSVRLSVLNNGDKVVRQSHRYLRYQPGKSQTIVMTCVLGSLKALTRQRIGYFDDSNGICFEQNGVSLAVVQRSSGSGSPVDTAVTQANWNLDRLDGTGPSGLTVNPALAQIYWIDLQWLGVGRVRLGVVINGQLVYCHQFLNANAIPSVYMTTANLPVRYELEMTGATTAGAARNVQTNNLLDQLVLTINAAGNTADTLSIVCTAFTGSVAANGSLGWREPR